MSSGDVAGPANRPLPKLAVRPVGDHGRRTRAVRPLTRAVRWAALAALRARWTEGRLDLVLASGERARLGPRGPADATLWLHDDRLFRALVARGELGAGEAFVDGAWSASPPGAAAHAGLHDDDLVRALRVILRGTAARGVDAPLARLGVLPALARHRLAANTPAGSRRNIRAHYDLGNAFYQLFLDDATLAYSCAYYGSGATTLADAQRAKLERLCDALALAPRDHLLEIGCGWGGMAIHAARTRGCRVTAITVSPEQHALATARVAAAGLGARVAIELRDYRALEGRYDKLVSIEMVEAVGEAYLPGYFAHCARVLAPGGRFALQSITMPHARFGAYRRRVDWMQTYVFPGSLIPSIEALARAAAPAGFRITAQHDIGPDYAPTLRAWRAGFAAALPQIRARFGERFVRTWRLYLAFSEAAFAERTLQDHQLVLER